MKTCYNCSEDLIESLNFCFSCETQVKCLSCEAFLYPNKTKCLKCGQPIKQDTSTNEMSTYVFDEKVSEKSSSRRIELKATDKAIDAFLTRLPMGSTPLPRKFANQESLLLNSSGSQRNKSPQQPLITILPNPEHETVNIDNEISMEITPDFLFSESPDYGLIPTKTLRDHISSLAKKKDQQETLIFMFIWAYNSLLEQPAPKEKLNALLRYEKLDANSVRYMSAIEKDYLISVDGGYKLHEYHGIKKIQQIVGQITNPPEISEGESKPIRKKSKSSAKPDHKSLQIIEPWLSMDIGSVEDFDGRKLQKASDWAAFGLYIITKVLKVKESISANHCYLFLSKRFHTLPVKKGSLIESMRVSKDKFVKKPNGEYYLTEEAETKIKNIISGHSI